MKFKVGDKVELVSNKNDWGTDCNWGNSDGLRIGKIYIVIDVGYNLEGMKKQPGIVLDNTINHYWHDYTKFKLADSTEKPDELSTWRKEFPHLKKYIKEVMK